MKLRMINLLMAAGLSTVFGGLTLQAQNLRATADIPFSFHAQGRTLAPGSYSIREMNNSGVFQLSGDEGSTFVNANLPGSEVKDSKLVFACYGHDCVLSEIDIEGAAHAQRVSESAIEKSLPRRLGFASMIAVPLRAR